jgi:hypothetical protein
VPRSPPWSEIATDISKERREIEEIKKAREQCKRRPNEQTQPVTTGLREARAIDLIHHVLLAWGVCGRSLPHRAARQRLAQIPHSFHDPPQAYAQLIAAIGLARMIGTALGTKGRADMQYSHFASGGSARLSQPPQPCRFCWRSLDFTPNDTNCPLNKECILQAKTTFQVEAPVLGKIKPTYKGRFTVYNSHKLIFSLEVRHDECRRERRGTVGFHILRL